MEYLQAATYLIELHSRLTKVEADSGRVIPPEYAEAVALAVMALKG